MARVKLATETDEIVAAVSLDPYAIAFVDLAAIPTTGQTVKVLAIQTGAGDQVRVVAPSPESIRNGTYPLARHLYLYVHPNANATAKDFAHFLATAGASEANLYTDPASAIRNVFDQHHLIYLAAPPSTPAVVAAVEPPVSEPDAKSENATPKRDDESPRGTIFDFGRE